MLKTSRLRKNLRKIKKEINAIKIKYKILKKDLLLLLRLIELPSLVIAKMLEIRIKIVYLNKLGQSFILKL